MRVAPAICTAVYTYRRYANSGASHLVRGHVGASARAIHGEEAEASDVQAVEVAVGVGHKLAALLRRCIGGNREIDHVLLAENLWEVASWVSTMGAVLLDFAHLRRC